MKICNVKQLPKKKNGSYKNEFIIIKFKLSIEKATLYNKLKKMHSSTNS